MIANALAIGSPISPLQRSDRLGIQPPRIRRALQAPLPKHPPSVVENHGREGKAMSCANNPKTLGEALPQRVKWALRRRLRPNTAITRQQLAGDTGLSESTIDNLLNGSNSPSAETLDILRGYFGIAIIAEIFAAPGLEDLQAARLQAVFQRLDVLRDEAEKILTARLDE